MRYLAAVLCVLICHVIADSSSDEENRRQRGNLGVLGARPITYRSSATTHSITTTTTTQPPLDRQQSLRPWTFAVTYYQKPYVYLKRGKMTGFTVDLIRRVCDIASRECHLIYLPGEECTRTVNKVWFPGKGLMGGDFDACVWWPITVERQNSVAFTNPYRVEKPARWLVRNGNPTKFDPKNLTKKKIVTVNGWYPTQVCLESVGREGGTFIVATSTQEAAFLVTSGNADALFSQLTSVAGLELLPDVVTCTTGSGMMVKKGSRLPDWWNEAFAEYVRCGCYKKLCEDSLAQHGNSAVCLDLKAGICATPNALCNP